MKQIYIESDLLDDWMRTSFLDDQGRVFLPCGVFADEMKATLCLSYDGQAMISHEGHVYAPTSWLAREYPQHKQAINSVASRIIREHGDTEMCQGL